MNARPKQSTPRNRTSGRRPLLALALSLAVVLVLAACTVWHPPNLGTLYDRAAQHHGPDRNPIVVIPGVMGSNLVDSQSGRTVWGTFTGNYASPRRAADLRLLALPMRLGAPLHALRDTVRPNGVLDRVRLRVLGIPIEVRAYVQILAALGVGGYVDQSLGSSGAVNYGTDHYTCFQFAYDWRRDNVENARRFGQFLAQKRAYVERQNRRRFGRTGKIRFDVVAHSMGGLLLRYYLRFGGSDLPADGSLPAVTWAGARQIANAVFVAPPNAGSLDALLDLVNGRRFGPFMPTYPAALLGTFPALYELLPHGPQSRVLVDGSPNHPVSDLFRIAVWRQFRWGLLSPTATPWLAKLLPNVPDPHERLLIARDQLAKSLDRAKAFAAALDQPAPPPPRGLSLFLVAGDAVPTARLAGVNSRTGRLTVLEQAPGDGTVLRTSALLDERDPSRWKPGLKSPIPWTETLFLFRDHLGLTKDKIFTDNVLYWLLERPAPSRPPRTKSRS